MTLGEAREHAKIDGLVETARAAARLYHLDERLVCAIAEQESTWDPYSIRPESESGFAARYGDNYAKIVKASASKADDRWFRFEDVFYCSYGLMQTLYCVIIETFPEAADILTFPTSLCRPALGLDFGCRLFAKKLKNANGDVKLALLRWNGGGRPEYVDEVLARLSAY